MNLLGKFYVLEGDLVALREQYGCLVEKYSLEYAKAAREVANCNKKISDIIEAIRLEEEKVLKRAKVDVGSFFTLNSIMVDEPP